MKQPAARLGDDYIKDEHVGFVDDPGVGNIQIIGRKAALFGGKCTCSDGFVDEIARGSMTVVFGRRPAVRAGDLTKLGGAIQSKKGQDTVHIGLAGISGNLLVGTRRCEALAAGRKPPPHTLDDKKQLIGPNTLKQSYDNCALEAARQLIHQVTGSNVTQEQLLAQAIANHWASPGKPGAAQMYTSGRTEGPGRLSLLAANGVSAHEVAPTMEVMEAYVSQGAGVMVDVYAGSMPNWQAAVPGAFGVGKGGHTVLVTGVEYDADGKPINVFINDTGLGQCGKKIPYDKFKAALMGHSANHVVTTKAIW